MDSMTDSQLLRQMMLTIEHFSKTTNERLSQVESTVAMLVNALNVQQQHSIITSTSNSTNTNTITNNNLNTNIISFPSIENSSPSPSPPQLCFYSQSNGGENGEFVGVSESISSQLRLELRVNPVIQRWFQNKAFPEFEVTLINTQTGEIFNGTRNWKVCVHLYSQDRRTVDHLLRNPLLVFDLDSGRANIFGVKISAVSGKNGGPFSFQISLQIPPTDPHFCIGKVQVYTNEFDIVTERLIAEKKVSSILELSSNDPLSRVPGIGKKYSKKLSEIGINTVRELALIDSSNSSHERRKNLLAEVRKDKGSLTEDKFCQLVRDSKTVVQKEQQNQNQKQNNEIINTTVPFHHENNNNNQFTILSPQNNNNNENNNNNNNNSPFSSSSSLNSSSYSSSRICSVEEFDDDFENERPAKRQKLSEDTFIICEKGETEFGRVDEFLSGFDLNSTVDFFINTSEVTDDEDFC